MSESKRRERLRQEAVKLTEELTAKGLLIEAGFASLKAMAFPNAHDYQVTFGREMFFAGAQHLFSSVIAILDPGDEPTDQDMRRMALISDELDRFQAEFMKKLPTEGNA